MGALKDAVPGAAAGDLLRGAIGAAMAQHQHKHVAGLATAAAWVSSND